MGRYGGGARRPFPFIIRRLALSDKEMMFVSFSGGRTSAYMSHWLLENKSDEYDFKFVFANTGCEHPATYDFIHKCDEYFGLDLVWLEAVITPEKGIGPKHKIVTYETASRNGEPFVAAIAKHGIPNHDSPQCTARLKQEPMWHHKRSLGFKSNHLTAIGIRSDEIDRMSPRAAEMGLVYPLCTMTSATEATVRHWWARMPFDLEIPVHYGNCCCGIPCWKKSDRKLLTIAAEHPEWFALANEIEQKYGHIRQREGSEKRVFFRGRTSAQAMIERAQVGDFVPFIDNMPPLQGGFDFDPLDIEEDCGAGCEIT